MVAAADDGIWPLFYAVVARERVAGVFTACMHPAAARRCGASTSSASSERTRTRRGTWTRGAVYAVPREGFDREWGNEWLRGSAVKPVLRVLVEPSDFPLREIVSSG